HIHVGNAAQEVTMEGLVLGPFKRSRDLIISDARDMAHARALQLVAGQRFGEGRDLLADYAHHFTGAVDWRVGEDADPAGIGEAVDEGFGAVGQALTTDALPQMAGLVAAQDAVDEVQGGKARIAPADAWQTKGEADEVAGHGQSFEAHGT